MTKTTRTDTNGAGRGSGGEAARAQASGTNHRDPLAEKHRSAFDKDWRTVNYSRLSGEGEGSAHPNRCRDSDLLRADWSPTSRSAKAGTTKSFPAKFASFVGGPFHAEVERLPSGHQRTAPTEPRGETE